MGETKGGAEGYYRDGVASFRKHSQHVGVVEKRLRSERVGNGVANGRSVLWEYACNMLQV